MRATVCWGQCPSYHVRTFWSPSGCGGKARPKGFSEHHPKTHKSDDEKVQMLAKYPLRISLQNTPQNNQIYLNKMRTNVNN
jgi:hypothetical protein